MPPSIASAACCISLPRMDTILTPSASDTTPAAASAVYSPSEKPAAALKVTPASASAASAAIEWVKIAIWLFSVRESVSLSLSKQSFATSSPAPSLASSKTSFAACEFSYRSLPMPGACAPWPGKNAKPYSMLRSSKNRRQTSEKVDNFVSFYYNSQGLLCQSNYCRFSTLFGRAI